LGKEKPADWTGFRYRLPFQNAIDLGRMRWLPVSEVVWAGPLMNLLAAVFATKAACTGSVFLRGRVKLLAMAAGKVDGYFLHFHCLTCNRQQTP
jgi:hypothetical protein